MEQLIMAAIVLVIVLVIRRREAFRFRWQPARSTWFALGVGLLAFLLSSLLLLVPTGSTAARLILYGGIYVVCGVALPWGYTLIVERATPADMGLRRERWRASLLLNVGVAALFLPILIFEGDWRAVDWGAFGRATVVLAGAGGLFELFLYYGLIHLRLERAFGVLPAILLTSALYVLWHAGTQLPLEPDPLMGAVKLFAVGVLYQSIFSLTRNLLTIWPFFHGVGVMIDFAVNVGEVGLVSREFPCALAALAGMAVVGVALAWLARRRPSPALAASGDLVPAGRARG